MFLVTYAFSFSAVDCGHPCTRSVFCLAVHRLRDKKNVPGYPAWDADILSTQYHSNWPTVHFACTCYTLLIDNGFGSRQRLLSRSGFQAALESPFSKPCRAAIPPSAALCIFMENLLLFLIGFSYVLNSNTFYRSCQSKFSSF